MNKPSTIADAFTEPRWPPRRYHYYYVRGKLASDPLYPGVVAALRGCDAPLLDLGCGIGLLAHALRADGQALRYAGVDFDAGKIAVAKAAADRAKLAGVAFATCDLLRERPSHRGSVALLDVLQYLPGEAQERVLDDAIAMLEPGSRLVVRSGLHDDNARGRTTRMVDRLANAIGWMRSGPLCYPKQEWFERKLANAGLAADFRPLHGRTPFNNWLIVATR
ncbi:class I SAM-dependent methyltransferase [Pseudoluteimonas lycopersici]|uniref:class I SAM-dependent methyltransferase n=1 Tax=Pseudoluteimonas lycopersici TaxID=1324796 RepID=UPI0031EF4B3F